MLGGVRAEVPRLPYRVHFVSIRNHTYSASSASHWSYKGPLVCCGIIHFSCDQAFVSVEPTTYIHLFGGGKKSVSRAVTLLVGEHVEEKMNGVAGFWGSFVLFLNGNGPVILGLK